MSHEFWSFRGDSVQECSEFEFERLLKKASELQLLRIPARAFLLETQTADHNRSSDVGSDSDCSRQSGSNRKCQTTHKGDGNGPEHTVGHQSAAIIRYVQQEVKTK